MSQTVRRSVECIGSACRSCPELTLDVNRYNLYPGERDPEFVNAIFCKHYRQCEKIMEHLRKNSNSYNEKDGV